MKLTSRYRFSASHRLDSPALSPSENRALYGKCNNPFGHGHDYVVDLTVEGEIGEDGQVVNRAALDGLVREQILAPFDHKNLNCDVPEFSPGFSGALVPTTENLARVIERRLNAHWNLAPRLVRVDVTETDRNSFAWEASRS